MKMTKKIMSLAIVFAMVMAMSVTAFAGSITVTGQPKETYKAYKIFDVTYNTAKTTYAYTIDSDAANTWFNDVILYMGGGETAATANNNGVYTGKGITLTPSAADPTVFVVTVDSDEENQVEDFDAEAFAAFLIGKTSEAKKSAEGTIAEDATTVTLTVGAGYYLVDSTLGALCILNTADDTVAVKEKNAEPTLEKVDDKETANIGDTVNFTITVTNGQSTDKAIRVHDKMDTGYTLNADSFKINGVAIASVTGASVTTTGLTDGCTFHVDFTAAYVEALADEATVTIKYSAVLNENAVIHTNEAADDDLNENEAWLTYSAQESTHKKTDVSTFKFDLDKVNGDDEHLTGAKFRLYDAAEGGNEIPLVVVSTGVYRHAKTGETGVEMVVDANGQITIQGLANGTYYLEETVAPDGYNILAARQAVVINGANILRDGANFGVEVENLAGTELPSTGGIGTTIFYALGGLMAVGAGVLLVAKKRMEA